MEPATGAAPVWSRLQDECMAALPSRQGGVAALDGFAPSTSRVRAGRSGWLSYRAFQSANRTCTGLPSLPTTSVAIYALAEFEMERAPGLAPGKGGFAIRRLDSFGIARFCDGVTAGIRTWIFWFTARNSDS
jgi:hypothetical protein